MDLERLKRETLLEHRATESVMPLIGDDLTREQYGITLQRLYRFVRSWEEWAQAHAPNDLSQIVTSRQRAPLLERDLQRLGMHAETHPIPFPAAQVLSAHPNESSFRASFLGAMYVMEGSRLGGQYIAHHVEKSLQLKAGEGDAYFRGHAERTGELWRTFKSLLAALPETDADTVIASAKAMFGVFREALIA